MGDPISESYAKVMSQTYNAVNQMAQYYGPVSGTLAKNLNAKNFNSPIFGLQAQGNTAKNTNNPVYDERTDPPVSKQPEKDTKIEIDRIDPFGTEEPQKKAPNTDSNPIYDERTDPPKPKTPPKTGTKIEISSINPF